MPSLNLELSFFEHRKVRRLVSLAGRGSEAQLIRLWCYCGTHHPEDGSLAGYSPEEIELIADWRGKPGLFVEALAAAGWLDSTEAGYVVHDWTEHQGHLYAYKTKASAMAKARWDKVRAEAAGNAASIAPSTKSAPRDAPSNAASIAASNAPSMLQAMPMQCSAVQGKAELPDPPNPPRGAAAVVDHLEIPEKLKTQPFAKAWAQWQTYRRGQKRVKDWVMLFRKQLEALSEYDADTATRMLNQSMYQGWTGIFPLKNDNRNPNRGSVAGDRNHFIGELGCESDDVDRPFA